MTGQEEQDFERLMRPHWRRLFFALVGVVGIGIVAAFVVGQMANEAKAALADLQGQVREMQEVKDQLIGITRRMDGFEAHLRVQGNDIQWIREAIKNGGK